MVIVISQFKKSFKVFLTSAILEGGFCLIYLFATLSKPKTAWVLGYSKPHWFSIFICLVTFASIAGFSIKAWRDSAWKAQVIRFIQVASQKEVVITTIWTVILGTISLLITAVWTASSNSWGFIPGKWTYRIGGYLNCLKPFFLWIGALSIQALIMLRGLGYKVMPSYRALQIFSVLSLPVLYVFSRSLGEDHYREINKEDRLIEWLTVGVFIITALLAFVRALSSKTRSSLSFWFLLIFSLACIFFALEEISWGQRIFGVESTEYFLDKSDQQEINVHNVVNEIFSVRTKHVAAWTLLAYGVALPILAINRRVRSFVGKLGVVLSPLFLIPGYIFSSILTWDRYFSGQDEEIAEFFFSLLLCLVIIFHIWYTDPKNALEEKKLI